MHIRHALSQAAECQPQLGQSWPKGAPAGRQLAQDFASKCQLAASWLKRSASWHSERQLSARSAADSLAAISHSESSAGDAPSLLLASRSQTRAPAAYSRSLLTLAASPATIIGDDLKCYVSKNRCKSSGEPKVKANPLKPVLLASRDESQVSLAADAILPLMSSFMILPC